MRAGLRDGSVPVNAAGEAYVVAPACFETFAAGRELAPATDRHRVVRLGRHRQRTSRSGAANLFRAVLADGSRIEGMVFPGELIWDDDPPPGANAGMVRKGRRPAPAGRPFAPCPRTARGTASGAPEIGIEARLRRGSVRQHKSPGPKGCAMLRSTWCS